MEPVRQCTPKKQKCLTRSFVKQQGVTGMSVAQHAGERQTLKHASRYASSTVSAAALKAGLAREGTSALTRLMG